MSLHVTLLRDDFPDAVRAIHSPGVTPDLPNGHDGEAASEANSAISLIMGRSRLDPVRLDSSKRDDRCSPGASRNELGPKPIVAPLSP